MDTTKKLKPLESVDFAVIQKPLFGLLRNITGDLERCVDATRRTNDLAEQRLALLLLIMVKVAVNSYEAASFLISDLDENSKRKPRFVFVLPPINRQMIDLWFSLVYIMDDLRPRALAYEQSGYKETVEDVERMKQRYGSNLDWRPWFEDMQSFIHQMEEQIPLSDAQKSNPSKEIDYWRTPYKLSQKPGRCQEFLKFLLELIYDDTSGEAHLKPDGLFVVGSFLIKDKAPEHIKTQLENRVIHQYKYRHFCRTVVALLGILSEIEAYGRFNNHEQLMKVWTLLAGHNADAKDVYDKRYRSLLEGCSRRDSSI